ncbi:uncharacterized protein LAESUDRAFT_647021 [Laetiporus sulphureus 93-53]|uniref:Uncharacterized protein n=1 Tax=Laetiporus sulphureus 93-53 TaxID=1314785 RepID=A0A165FN25_9APHY|nr:uncharacterized protein LAESUDRAFT_647021 [Laetiporus sulphureus 93-53]KZT09216.1 hypothetical protein LAESUDRAFT_647021 [Laetiporus sulphureus 93-53]
MSNGKIRPSEKKRQRSRSKSITPPPELDVQTIQKTRDTVREIMGFAPRPVSPAYDADEDELVDNVELDPELAVIAQEIQRQASQLGWDETPVIEGGGPEKVSIKVRWVPHPQDTSRKSELFEYVLKRHDTFDQVIDEVADFVAVLADRVYLMMDNKRVFPSATPHSLGVWAEAELEACEKFTFDYLQSARRQRSLSIQPIDMRERSLSELRTPSPLLEESDGETGVELLSEEEQDDKMKLTLRSAETKDISLTVRPTTTCVAILKAFLKKAGIADQYPGISASPKNSRGRKGTTNVPALVIDGEKLSPASQIGDADVEDGDLVEVVGL